ncbi:MAG: penicillin-binding transpeptidase domain-containing protein [Veillonella sp.]|uniref:penicillin-binding transpeptidase domain-containing protein n=1 Tax=Veillonella sp. TaxID=1926307 RepID=UPI00290E0749|nr:penicillin-binding transpeptidase domain-containing protein [Veillonella sp.]MDU4398404.1 penicillin-binding transpeptidase domain-containing protein [Veillonella sp.]
MNISGNDNKRIEYTVRVLLCIAVVLVGRLFFLQIIDKSDLQAKNLSQVQVDRKLQSPRGTIYDRNGRPLAMSVVTKSLYADPKMIKQSPSEVAELIAPYVTMSKEDIVKSLQEDTAFVWIDRMMEPEKSKAVAQLIEDKNLEGLNFVEESKRYYPNGNLAAQVLGFVGTDDKGLDGLEMVLDDELKGGIQKELVATDRKGNAIFGSVLSKYLPDKGKSVTLTIDASIQFIAERALDKAMEDTGAKHASVIVMDPKTGEILAMANRPTYDPNHYSQGSEEDFKNIAVTNLYEPGSTFKPIIASAALASGKWKLDQVYNDKGSFAANGHVMQNWNGEGYGPVRLIDILKFSINTGMAEIGTTTGADILSKYVRNYGFGSKTGIELPGEGDGILYNPDDMSKLDVATMSIGQGIAVTPLQMVRAFGALSNGGAMMKPHIIKSYSNSQGDVTSTTETSVVGQPVPAETAKTIVDILEKEVSEGGGTKAMVEGYHFGGKTGTAQKLDTKHGGYLDGQYIASFIGFGPVEDPKFVVLVVIDDPQKGSYYGSQIVAPVFKDIVSQLVRYYQMSPYVKESTPVAVKAANTLPEPKPGSDGSVTLPNFTGFTYGEVRDWLHKAGLAFKPDGTGTATSQDESSGTTVQAGTAITVHFRR